jgi:hypothetical protein
LDSESGNKQGQRGASIIYPMLHQSDTQYKGEGLKRAADCIVMIVNQDK